MNHTDTGGWDETARETLIEAVAGMLKGQHGQPFLRVERRKVARQLVDSGPLLPNLRNILRVYLEQNRRMWSVIASTLAAHPELLAWATRRTALLQAREQHQNEGVPFWVTGKWAPSGCRVCGHPEHTLRQKTALGGHAFTSPRLGTDRWRDRVEANQQLLDGMRHRRHDRANWFRERGYDGCHQCGVPSSRHPDEHQIWLPDPDDPWAPFDRRHVQTGPYVPPTDDQVLGQVARHRAARWDHLHPESWFDAWDEAGRDEIRAGMSDLDRAIEAGLDLDDE